MDTEGTEHRKEDRDRGRERDNPADSDTGISLQVRAGSEPEVEAFVHGALCVSYSGQCFSSEVGGCTRRGIHHALCVAFLI